MKTLGNGFCLAADKLNKNVIGILIQVHCDVILSFVQDYPSGVFIFEVVYYIQYCQLDG